VAIPSAPSLDELCAEGLKKGGYVSGTAQYTAMLARANTTWIAEINNDIYTLSKELKTLQKVYPHITVPNRSRYIMPTDYQSNLKFTLLDGTEYGTATAGAATTITLAAAEDITEANILGKYIVITGGTGVNQIAQVTAYSTTTKVATIFAETINGEWATNPGATSTYLICDEVDDLEYRSISEADLAYDTQRDEPTAYILSENETYGEFKLWPSPYRADTGQTIYVVLQRYYANIMLLDSAGTLMSLLYRRWRNTFVQGIFYKTLQHKDDDRTLAEESKYYTLLKLMMSKETPLPESQDFVRNSIG